MEVRKGTIGQEALHQRLDHWLAATWPEWTRSRWQNLLREGLVTVNGAPGKAGCRLREGDTIEARIPDPEPSQAQGENIPLDILYEDEVLLVLNKPPGMVVHPAPGHARGTLVNALIAHCGTLSQVGGVFRPGIIHRLDKDTSGLLLVAKNDAAHHFLSRHLAQRLIKREYLALLAGNLKEDRGTVDAPIGRSRSNRKKMGIVEGGRRAVTHWEVLERFGEVTLVRVRLETGRTHQIRVHFASLSHPVANDEVYGGGSVGRYRNKRLQALLKSAGGLSLHAAALTFTHPVSGEELRFEQAPPPGFAAVLQFLRDKGR